MATHTSYVMEILAQANQPPPPKRRKANHWWHRSAHMEEPQENAPNFLDTDSEPEVMDVEEAEEENEEEIPTGG